MVEERIANKQYGIKYSSILTEIFLRCIDKGLGRNVLCCFRLSGKSMFCVMVG
jgi:hypothetical protein